MIYKTNYDEINADNFNEFLESLCEIIAFRDEIINDFIPEI